MVRRWQKAFSINKLGVKEVKSSKTNQKRKCCYVQCIWCNCVPANYYSLCQASKFKIWNKIFCKKLFEEYSFVSVSWHFIKFLKSFFSSWLLIPKGRLAVFMFTSWNQFNNVCIKCSMAITEESIYVMLSLNVESYPKWVVGGLLLLCYCSGQSLTARDRSSLCPGSMKNTLRSWISWRPWPGARPSTSSPGALTAGSPAPPALCSSGWPCS